MCSSFSVKEFDVIVHKKYFPCITLSNFGHSVPTSLANLVVEVGTRHSHHILLSIYIYMINSHRWFFFCRKADALCSKYSIICTMKLPILPISLSHMTVWIFFENCRTSTQFTLHMPVKLPWIFPGAPLKINGAPKNIQGNLTGILKIS